MDFAFTEEQQMIRDTAESFLQDVSSSEAIRTAMATDAGYDAALWQQICQELYFQAITIPESLGGMGLGYVELCAVMEQMGRYLLCAPYFATVCQATTALLEAGDESQQAEYLTKVLEGAIATLAYTSSNQTGVDAVEAEFSLQDQAAVINGQYRFVVDGHNAEFVVAAAKDADNKIGLFVVPMSTAGIDVKWVPTMDQTRKQAELSFNNVKVEKDGILKLDAAAELAKILDLATICLAAEQMGGASEVLDITVDYTKERVQFNRPVASFQAIKHRAADMMTKAECAKSAVYYAACVAQDAFTGGELADELAEAASIAKANVSDAYFQNAGDAIQLHGGVGFTWEYDPHLYFKRAKASEHMLGNSTYHRERLAQMLLA
ncbi:MAG: acyl-CoA/acyl-ACP dehydrogenase [Pseudomonadales bacterium]|nr:acyl-CoA/acyl-ACP dehydrogenase [Pseudomonadales bacterium]